MLSIDKKINPMSKQDVTMRLNNKGLKLTKQKKKLIINSSCVGRSAYVVPTKHEKMETPLYFQLFNPVTCRSTGYILSYTSN